MIVPKLPVDPETQFVVFMWYLFNAALFLRLTYLDARWRRA